MRKKTRRINAILLTLVLALGSVLPAYADEKTIEETYISDTAKEACIEYGELYGICPELLMAIIERESGGKADAENGSCKGLMQISTKWHKDRMKRLGVTDIFDERSNILVGTDLISELSEQYEDIGIMLMVYHGEKNATTKALSKYARGILERSAELEELHDK